MLQLAGPLPRLLRQRRSSEAAVVQPQRHRLLLGLIQKGNSSGGPFVCGHGAHKINAMPAVAPSTTEKATNMLAPMPSFGRTICQSTAR